MNKALLLAAALLVIPTASFAATYHYVDTSGIVRSIESSSAQAALGAAVNIAPHSGVAFDLGVIDAGDSVNGTGSASAPAGTHLYHYVDTSGIVRSVYASSDQEALALAINKAPASGVSMSIGILQDGVSVVNQ